MSEQPMFPGFGDSPTPTVVPSVTDARKITRRAHPVTSLMAAEELIESESLIRQEQRALDLVRQHPGKTGYELDRLAGCEKREISKRLGGLKNKEVLRRGKRRMCEVNGTQCVTWYVFEDHSEWTT